ncbi:MAG: hypothetical protein ABIH70_10305 [Chloroflexota bacterium]
MNLQANCKTMAMGIMPHTDVEQALNLALSLDIPFWPQLPKIDFGEDMYAQTSRNFPGIMVDVDNEKISFSTARFEEEVADYSQNMVKPETFALDPNHSITYHSFLSRDLGRYPAIRGQITGPVSFGFRVTDESNRPIIYNDGIRALLFDFIQRKTNFQCGQLKEKNPNAFVWLDEPGLGWVFSGLSGYSDIQAKQDYRDLVAGLDGIKALHLCANVNLPYLLDLGIGLLSFDAYQIELMPKGYAKAVADFIAKGGVIAWGIIPTDSVRLLQETPETLVKLLSDYWEVISQNAGLPVEQIASQSLLAPARCCLRNIGRVGASDDAKACERPERKAEEELVEKAFDYLSAVSAMLKNKFNFKNT